MRDHYNVMCASFGKAGMLRFLLRYTGSCTPLTLWPNCVGNKLEADFTLNHYLIHCKKMICCCYWAQITLFVNHGFLELKIG